MRKVGATELRSELGEILKRVNDIPVEIFVKGQSVAVMISSEEFQRLASLEDAVWAIEANIASEEGFVSEEQSEAVLRSLVDDED